MDGTLFPTHLTEAEIEAGMAAVLASPQSEGTLEMIVQRPKVNARRIVELGELNAESGLVGDNWASRGSRWRRGGDPLRQLTVMNWRFALLVAGTAERAALAGDQLYVDLNLSAENVPPGTRLKIGTAIIEVTRPPHRGCKKFAERFGLDAMRFADSDAGRRLDLRGVNARVVVGGVIRTGDTVQKLTANGG